MISLKTLVELLTISSWPPCPAAIVGVSSSVNTTHTPRLHSGLVLIAGLRMRYFGMGRADCGGGF